MKEKDFIFDIDESGDVVAVSVNIKAGKNTYYKALTNKGEVQKKFRDRFKKNLGPARQELIAEKDKEIKQKNPSEKMKEV